MAGYIGSKVAVVSSGAERKKVFTATSGQTSFTGLSYTVNNVHVFQNGVRLVDGTDYTATNGNSITLTVGAATDDQVVVVSYNTFQTSDTVSASTGGTFAGDVNFTGAFTSQGIDDNATSTAMTLDGSGNLLVGKTALSSSTDGFQFTVGSSAWAAMTNSSANALDELLLLNRTGSDGELIQFKRGATTVGVIGTNSSRLTIGNGDTGLLIAGDLDNITPFNTSTNASRDAAVDLGNSGVRFKDLYLSGGVYLGGTTAANKLDDYEEGHFTATLTPTVGGSITLKTTQDRLSYTKIGNFVHIGGRLDVSSVSSPTGALKLTLPFTTKNGDDLSGEQVSAVWIYNLTSDVTGYYVMGRTGEGSTNYYIEAVKGDSSPLNLADRVQANSILRFGIVYQAG